MNYVQNVVSISALLFNCLDLFNTPTGCGCRYPRILIFIAPCISTPNGVSLVLIRRRRGDAATNNGSPAVLLDAICNLSSVCRSNVRRMMYAKLLAGVSWRRRPLGAFNEGASVGFQLADRIVRPRRGCLRVSSTSRRSIWLIADADMGMKWNGARRVCHLRLTGAVS